MPPPPFQRPQLKLDFPLRRHAQEHPSFRLQAVRQPKGRRGVSPEQRPVQPVDNRVVQMAAQDGADPRLLD